MGKSLVMHVLETPQSLTHDVSSLLLAVALQFDDAIKELTTSDAGRR